MRVRQIHVRKWRHFSGIKLDVEADAGLICVVGANGTGKSHLLELISACAHRVGLTPGIEIPRGDPFADEHDFTVQITISPGVSEAVDQGLSSDASFGDWDRTLTIESAKPGSTRITAGGLTGNDQTNFAGRVVQQLKQSKNVHFLSLDADRAYPKKNFAIHEIAQAYDIDWSGTEYTRGRSFRSTTTLYDEWVKYFLAQENQSGTRILQAMRKAKKAGEAPPEFTDHFADYAESLQSVLPHVLFTGVDPQQRTLLFDTTGLELRFAQLSGGEREIAFLVGQIDRFGLRNGLFLLDEPELHLNADLIRTWVSYLTGTVGTGQVWLATHSLEAVEAAGQAATYVLERNDESRVVDTVARLDTRPVLSALSRAVGTPAFSVSQLRFVFVEGEEGVGEREKFHGLAGAPQSVRFLECGSCNEVLRRVSSVEALANEMEGPIRVGGIIDRGFRARDDARDLAADTGVLVLPVHEVENLFLEPGTLRTLLVRNGRSGVDPIELVRSAADERAGAWIFQHALGTRNLRDLPPISPSSKEKAKALSWDALESREQGAVDSIVASAGISTEDGERLAKVLHVYVEAYRRRREDPDLWKHCEGKEVLHRIAPEIGFAGADALTRAASVLWNDPESGAVFEELQTLRDYVQSL